MMWLLDTKIGRGLMFVLGILGTIFFFWLRGKSQGQQQAIQKVQAQDAQTAIQTVKAAEAAKASVSVTPSNVDKQLSDLHALRND